MRSTKHPSPLAQSPTDLADSRTLPASTITVAGILAERRAAARIPHILRRCLSGSTSAGRAAIDSSSPVSPRAPTPFARRAVAHGADSRAAARGCSRDDKSCPPLARRTRSSQQTNRSFSSVATKEATNDEHYPLQSGKPPQTGASPKSRPPPRVPRTPRAPIHPVVAGPSRDPPRTPRTVHILGQDRGAAFLASELQPLYDSVHLFKNEGDKLVDYKFDPANPWEGHPTTCAEEERKPSATSETPIKNLITTGPAVEAVQNISQLKHRMDDETTLCLMHNGLGVAEQINETVLNEDADAKPEYVLGHIDRKHIMREPRGRSLDRPPSGNTRGLIHVHPDLTARFTPIDPAQSRPPKESPLASQLVDTLRPSPNLHAQLTPFHAWLHIKLHAMIITSAVDPVCAIVGCRYDELPSIKWGMNLMMMLLDEIQRVVAALPEVHNSPRIRAMVEKETLRKACVYKLTSMKPKTSANMASLIERGQLVDVDSFNGYFVRRGKQLGVDCPHNEMVVAMIKARHGMRKKELEREVPFEVTSRPHRGSY